MKHALVILLLVFGMSAAHGTILTAASGSYSDVKAKCDLAVAGDTVIIPAGTASWTSQLTLTKDITLKGSTTVTKNSETSYTLSEGTIILDDVTRTGNLQTDAVIWGNFTAGQHPRITGITIKKGSITTESFTSVIYVNGTCATFRIDNCSFSQLPRYNFYTGGSTFGVVDHCYFYNDTGNEKTGIYLGSYPNGTTQFGDGSWAAPPYFGTDKAIYMEDCEWSSPSGGKHGSTDGASGSRRVTRHCYFLRAALGGHGTESGGRLRSARMDEEYLNTIDLRDSGATGMQWRGGTMLIWGNTWLTDVAFTHGRQLAANRQLNKYSPWGGAGGANSFDANDTEGDGTYVEDHTPHTYFSGTTTATTSNNTCVQSGAGWTTNQWVGYEVTNESTLQNGLIWSNTSDTLTLAPPQGGNQNFSSGVNFTIRRLAQASLDQPGRGAGDVIAGAIPANVTHPGQWAHQALEPIYGWMNTNNGAPYTDLLQVSSSMPTIQANRDYYNEATTFDGSVGVGAGLLSARPSSGLTAGVGYWATDTNTLFVATNATTWATYYQPYTYPHPLTGGATGAIITLSGDTNFGNVIIGDTPPTRTVTVRNDGSTTLTASSVAYTPAEFTGSTAGFSVAAGATRDITVTFTPGGAQDYSGTITVNSDATGGTGTIAVSGRGVVGPNNRPFSVWRKIKQLLGLP